MRKFELFLGCLGNGTTVCNKAVMEHGDYKHIAHISPAGNIKLYVDSDYIPTDAMDKIRSVAEIDGLKFREDFEKRSIGNQYITILNNLSPKKLLEVTADKRTIQEKLPELREYYYSNM